ncbi:hypothetical protein [Phenylobacterium sp.]|jgi:hypothetical protein|uniref:hypothetical protein n=1 Tax=Phenylobacterium sp. TaxID=1871053 RepID=UPI002E37DACE|nr:hypothetical protein [Phenylobacterium sp.]HEX2559623.1 hypothetical protein [Phenylobacterium sp.]
MRLPPVLAALASLCAAAPAAAAPAVAHILIEQHAAQRGDPARYVVRAQQCKDEVFRELRLADGRAPSPIWVRERTPSLPPNPMIRQVLDEGGLPAAQVLVAAINVCLGAQGLSGVRAALSAEPSPDAPLE